MIRNDASGATGANGHTHTDSGGCCGGSGFRTPSIPGFDVSQSEQNTSSSQSYQFGAGPSDLVGGIAGMGLGGAVGNYFNGNGSNDDARSGYPSADSANISAERSYPGAFPESEDSRGHNYGYYHTDEGFHTEATMAAAASAQAQQAGAGDGSRSVAGGGDSSAMTGAGYGALMGMAGSAFSNSGSSSAAGPEWCICGSSCGL